MCGSKLKEGSSFCLTCGTPVRGRKQSKPTEQTKPIEQPIEAEQTKPNEEHQPVEQLNRTEPPRPIDQPRQAEKPRDAIIAVSFVGLFSKLFAVGSLFMLLITMMRSFVYEGLHEVFHVGYHYVNIIGSMGVAGLALLLGIVELLMSIGKKSPKINVFNIIARLAAIISLLVFLAIMLVENINL